MASFLVNASFLYRIYKAEKRVYQEPALSLKQYKKMEALMCDFIEDRIVEKQGIFTLPEALGTLMFRQGANRREFYGRATHDGDTEYTKGGRVRFMNTSTAGRYFVPRWDNDKRYIRNKVLYEFKLQGSILSAFYQLVQRINKDPERVIISK